MHESLCFTFRVHGIFCWGPGYMVTVPAVFGLGFSGLPVGP